MSEGAPLSTSQGPKVLRNIRVSQREVNTGPTQRGAETPPTSSVVRECYVDKLHLLIRAAWFAANDRIKLASFLRYNNLIAQLINHGVWRRFSCIPPLPTPIINPIVMHDA